MNKLTMEQAIIISGYTGYMAVPNFSILHADIAKRIGGDITTIGIIAMGEEKLTALYKEDFMKLIPDIHKDAEC